MNQSTTASAINISQEQIINLLVENSKSQSISEKTNLMKLLVSAHETIKRGIATDFQKKGLL